MKSATTKHHLMTAALIATFLGSATALLQKLSGSFNELVMPTGPYGGVGNASAPYSDALGPWLQGSLSYYLHDVPLDYLYRPTVGLFFSGILSATNRVAAIPVIFIGFFLLTLTGIFAASDNPRRAVLSATLTALVLFYAELVRPLNPEALMVDFWAMSFGLIAIWLLGLSQARVASDLFLQIAGFLLLGIAATIRGPQLAAGGVALLYLGVGWVRRGKWLHLALAALVFGAPLGIDAAIQKRYHVINNGVAVFYCIYATPEHAWSSAGQEQYLHEAPSNHEVVFKFGAFLVSPEGAVLLAKRCNQVLLHSVTVVTSPALLLLLAGGVAVGWVRRTKNSGAGSDVSVRLREYAPAIIVVALLLIRACSDLERTALLSLTLIGLAAFSIRSERRWTALFTLAYASSLLLHALLALASYERVLATYEVFLIAALLAACWEPPAICEPAPAGQNWIGVMVLVVVVLGYAGNFIFRRGFKSELRNQLAGTHTVVKISNSLSLDRSLYMTGELGLFYTRCDPVPFGIVRPYIKINSPAGWYNPSFLQPCTVEFQDALK